MRDCDKNDYKCQYLLDYVLNVNKKGELTYKKTQVRVPTYTSVSGYQRVHIRIKGELYRVMVHRLVLVKYKGSQPLECDHKDGNKSNNALSNLRYVTRKENMATANLGGAHKPVLTQEEVLVIRQRHAEGVSKGQLAREYGVNHTTIANRLKNDYATSRNWVKETLTKHFVNDKPLKQYCLENGICYTNCLKQVKKGKCPEGYWLKELK